LRKLSQKPKDEKMDEYRQEEESLVFYNKKMYLHAGTGTG